jgi:hypothetical protein
MGWWGGRVEWRDEWPRRRFPAHGFVVAFDVADAREGSAGVEAEAFVVVVGPDRAAGERLSPLLAIGRVATFHSSAMFWVVM